MNKLEQLQYAKENGGTITYLFKDGTKQVQNLNKEIFVDHKGKALSPSQIMNVFETTAHDLKAIGFEF